MTELEWLASRDPQAMLTFLRGRASERKLRLFACACFRLRPGTLAEKRDRHVVKLAERYADGEIGGRKLAHFPRAGWGYDTATPLFRTINWAQQAREVAGACVRVFGADPQEGAGLSDTLRELFG